MDAAKQMDWDPSVQALVVFPDVMATLTRDVQWTTDLGNAVLAQQADVMAAIQRMRASAQQNGRLATTPQQVVTTDTEDGQSAIQIQPADPQVIYVPVYNPAYVWGPPAWGYYPSLWYPTYGFGFGPGIALGAFFGGFLGWGGWGWGLSWLAHGLFLNGLFFSHFGFHGFSGYGPGFARPFGERMAWVHDPAHRQGVAYTNRAVASRFGSARAGSNRMGAAASSRGSQRFSSGSRAGTSGAGAYPGSAGYGTGAYRAGASNYSARNYSARNYSTGNYSRNYSTPNYSVRAGSAGSYRGTQNFASRGTSRSYSSARSYSAPRSYGGGGGAHYSAPRSSGHVSSGHSSGGHSGGGHSGGHRR